MGEKEGSITTKERLDGLECFADESAELSQELLINQLTLLEILIENGLTNEEDFRRQKAQVTHLVDQKMAATELEDSSD